MHIAILSSAQHVPIMSRTHASTLNRQTQAGDFDPSQTIMPISVCMLLLPLNEWAVVSYGSWTHSLAHTKSDFYYYILMHCFNVYCIFIGSIIFMADKIGLLLFLLQATYQLITTHSAHTQPEVLKNRNLDKRKKSKEKRAQWYDVSVPRCFRRK